MVFQEAEKFKLRKKTIVFWNASACAVEAKCDLCSKNIQAALSSSTFSFQAHFKAYFPLQF